MYNLFIPQQAVGANLVYFDLFVTSTAPCYLEVQSVRPVYSSSAGAVTGTLSVNLHLTRTTAVGTGGTAATVEGTSLTAATFSHLNGAQPFDTTYVTARLTPSGGATAGAVLAFRSIFSEETSAASYAIDDFVLPGPPVIVQAGTGLRVVQGSVASVGQFGFNVRFRALQRP